MNEIVEDLKQMVSTLREQGWHGEVVELHVPQFYAQFLNEALKDYGVEMDLPLATDQVYLQFPKVGKVVIHVH